VRVCAHICPNLRHDRWFGSLSIGEAGTRYRVRDIDRRDSDRLAAAYRDSFWRQAAVTWSLHAVRT